ncbi:Transglycosylase associated protein OS=Bosea thiooxidans OX=53254 GN=SAMN05660750_00581 PE=4 SV=1 [Bosea thiooxidans]|uniref:Uncharacterized protein n=1 Tax=Bosea thiooxidans TaxID=53254 RepID=A0A1T5AZ12_9HYPH|nr:hypothetical protein [Bosea thiooxidans]SKB40000.1 hypothetical protein SAMN05660750_00581 [Bosea thiooxidans]
MSGMLWGALVGALIGLWGGMQRSAAVNGGRVSFHGADLLILIFGALVAAAFGAAVGYDLSGMR